MNKQNIKALLAARHDSFGHAAEIAQSILSGNSHLKIEVNEKLQSKEQCIEIYLRRLAFCEHQNVQIVGLKETLESFKRGSGPYRALAVTTDLGWAYIWVNESGNLIGCIAGTSEVGAS